MARLEVRPIKDYCLGIFDGPHATPKETDEGPIFLGIKNITDDGRLNFSEIRHVSEDEFPKWTRRVVPQAGDVVFTYEATLHRYAIIPDDFRGCLGRRVALIRPNPSLAVSKYLLYYFLSHEWRKIVEGNVISGATVDRIPLERFPDFPIALPPVSVQREVSSILSTYDDLIENNRRRMALLEESARLLYREWFIRLRFPGFEHTQVVDGVPKGWNRVKVETVLIKISKAKKIKKDDYQTAGDIPCIDQGAEFIGGYTDDPEALFNHPLPIIVFGDHTRILKFVNFPFASGADGTQLIYPDTSKVSPEFLYFALKEIDLSNYFYARHFKFLKEENILIPAETLVQEFTRTVSHCLDQINCLRTQNQKLRAARDLLLPRLMSGEITA